MTVMIPMAAVEQEEFEALVEEEMAKDVDAEGEVGEGGGETPVADAAAADAIAETIPPTGETATVETLGDAVAAAVIAEPTDSAADAAELPLDLKTLQHELRLLRQELSRREEFELEVDECSKDVESLAAEVLRCESKVESAKGELKSSREEYDSKVRELRAMLRDRESGQQRLAFGNPGNSPAPQPVQQTTQQTVQDCQPATGVDESASPSPAPEAPLAEVEDHSAAPIGQLSAKSIKKLIGAEEFERQKATDQPVGLTEKEMILIEGQDIATIGDLEKWMREDAWWHEKIKGFGEAKVQKLIETLRVWRVKFPMMAEINQ